MSFVAVDHPTDANSNFMFNSEELVFITADTHYMSGKPALTLTFKGEKKQIEVPYETVEDRDKVYKSILETFKPHKAYMKRVN
jgi:hypothetical protein